MPYVWFYSDTKTFTAPGIGNLSDCSHNPAKSFSLTVRGVGAAPTAWNVVLEGSLDNVNYTTMLTHVNTTEANGETKVSGATLFAVFYFRIRVVSLTLGGATGITVMSLGMQYQKILGMPLPA